MKLDRKLVRAELHLAERIATEECIRLDNERFFASSPAEQRVSLAKDVLEWLRIGKLKAKKNEYVTINMPVGDNSPIPETVNGYTCTACGVGSLFVVAVERGLLSTIRSRYGRVADGQEIKDVFTPYFPAMQLRSIELAFEGARRSMMYCPVPKELEKRSLKFCYGIKDNTQRLRKIMFNIIKNKGEFIP